MTFNCCRPKGVRFFFLEWGGGSKKRKNEASKTAAEKGELEVAENSF